ncbi:oligosaccharide biosynthesis protein Alg14 like-domain-containing protein [Geopyxis carbonaria]|nr:oligosaccharide biosynthesis protein Alg14 like-domain-containing protein [Geopyxis carbonaria]
MLPLPLLFVGAATILLLATLRLLYILPATPLRRLARPPTSPPARPRRHDPTRPPHLMVLLGSGGHTAEMLLLLRTLTKSAAYMRTYIVTSGDTLSAAKAITADAAASARVRTIPRARRVGQSWLSTPLDCVRCLAGCVRVFTERGVPDVVVCNGPGSCVVMVVVAVVGRFFGVAHTRTVYVESFARVKTLSLSGRLLYPIVDRFVVQWPGLQEAYPRAEYRGILV